MVLKNIRQKALILALCATATAPAFAKNIAVVNGVPISQERADAMLAHLGPQQANDAGLQAAVRTELINREVLYQEAKRKGFANQPQVKEQIETAKQSVVIHALVADYLKNSPVTDADIQNRYKKLLSETDTKEYHFHHILVDNEQQAKDLIAQLKKGANFENLAQKYSKDTMSAKNGGDLSWANAKAYIPEFSKAATALKKGQITDTPVHTQFGWHIIRFDDERTGQPPTLDQVKGEVKQQLENEKLQQWEQKLVSSAKIQ